MARRSSGSAEPVNNEPSNPSGDEPGEAGYPDDLWPDDLWPDDDDQPGSPGESGTRRPGPPGAPDWPGPGWPASGSPGIGPGRRRSRLISVLVIALVAGLAGAAIALVARDLRGPSGNAAMPSPRPSHLNPPQPGGMLPGPGSGGTAGIFLAGRVIAVSETSVTIGAQGQRLTAAVTGSTRVSGKVSSVSGIKVGDQVSAQISQSGGKATVIAIWDPARSPLGIGPG